MKFSLRNKINENSRNDITTISTVLILWENSLNEVKKVINNNKKKQTLIIIINK